MERDEAADDGTRPGGESCGGSDRVVLEVRGLSKAYGHVQALQEVSFSLHPGEVVALLGDNGAGKSTLIGILSGIYAADAGQIIYNGRAVTIRNPAEALKWGIGTTYQDLAVVDALDVASNIFLGRIPRHFGFVADYRRMYREAAALLDRLSVTVPSVRTRLRELSGGQRQAVAIARILAEDAKVLLMDEPTAALGVGESAKVNELILSLRSEGRTVLVTSHNMEHVFAVADRIVVLRRGRGVAIRERRNTSREAIVGLITGAIAGDVEYGNSS
jgi:ABC-type sugar transport system ATPase subunit